MAIAQGKRKKGESTFWYTGFQAYLFWGSDRILLGSVNLERAKNGKQKKRKIPISWVKADYAWQWKAQTKSWDDEQRHQREHNW